MFAGILSLNCLDYMPKAHSTEEKTPEPNPITKHLSLEEKINFFEEFLSKENISEKEQDYFEKIFNETLEKYSLETLKSKGFFEKYIPLINQKIGDLKTIQLLKKKLFNYQNPTLEQECLNSLIKIDDPKAIDALSEAFYNKYIMDKTPLLGLNRKSIIESLGNAKNYSAIHFLRRIYAIHEKFKNEVLMALKNFFNKENKITEDLAKAMIFFSLSDQEIEKTYLSSELSKNKELKKRIHELINKDQEILKKYIYNSTRIESCVFGSAHFLYFDEDIKFERKYSFINETNFYYAMKELISELTRKEKPYGQPFKWSSRTELVLEKAKTNSIPIIMSLDLKNSEIFEYSKNFLLKIGIEGFSVAVQEYNLQKNYEVKSGLKKVLLKLIDEEQDNRIKNSLMRAIEENSITELTYPLLLIENADNRASRQLAPIYLYSENKKSKEMALKYFKEIAAEF